MSIHLADEIVSTWRAGTVPRLRRSPAGPVTTGQRSAAFTGARGRVPHKVPSGTLSHTAGPPDLSPFSVGSRRGRFYPNFYRTGRHNPTRDGSVHHLGRPPLAPDLHKR